MSMTVKYVRGDDTQYGSDCVSTVKGLMNMKDTTAVPGTYYTEDPKILLAIAAMKIKSAAAEENPNNYELVERVIKSMLPLSYNDNGIYGDSPLSRGKHRSVITKELKIKSLDLLLEAKMITKIQYNVLVELFCWY